MSTLDHSSMANPQLPQETVAQTAADWVARRDRGLSAQEVRELTAWLEERVHHREEFDRVAGDWRKLDQIGKDACLTRMADAVYARARARRTRQRRWAWTGGLMAAAAAVALAFVGSWQTPLASLFNGTLASERTVVANAAKVQVLKPRQLTLPDGSVAELNGDSRIETTFTATERRVRLVQGEAFFSVTKDPARPFLVSVGPVAVRAVGTAFNVRYAAAAVEVLVTEGKVHVHGDKAEIGPTAEAKPVTPLTAGQRATVDIAANASAQTVAIVSPAPAEIDEALAWQRTRLVFDRTPLSEVVAVFNRYSTQQLILGDPALSSRTLTGAFCADNIKGFLWLLNSTLGVDCENIEGRTILRASR